MVDPRRRIDELRIERNMSLSQMARAIGVSDTSVYNWYNQTNSMPTVRVLERACQLFGVSMAELFCDSEYDKLTPEQLKLLDLFGKLNKVQQESMLKIIESIVCSGKAE